MKDNKVMNNHLKMMKRLNGDRTSGKYDIITSKDELLGAGVQAHEDLGYPLLKESYRDRYLIMNKKGIENEVERLIFEMLINNIHTLDSFVADDIGRGILYNLNGVSNNKNIFAEQLAKGIARGVVKGVMDIIDNEL